MLSYVSFLTKIGRCPLTLVAKPKPQVLLDKEFLESDVLFKALKDASYEQIDTFIDNNVKDLMSAKTALKILFKLVVYMWRHR